MPDRTDPRRRVLIVGVYLTFADSAIVPIVDELRRSREWRVDQRWIAIGPEVNNAVADVTVRRQEGRAPKFELMNDLLQTVDSTQYEFVIVCDDDITLPAGFVDRYLALVQRYDFALAQPARTHDSFIDHFFVEQLDGLAPGAPEDLSLGGSAEPHRG